MVFVLALGARLPEGWAILGISFYTRVGCTIKNLKINIALPHS